MQVKQPADTSSEAFDQEFELNLSFFCSLYSLYLNLSLFGKDRHNGIVSVLEIFFFRTSIETTFHIPQWHSLVHHNVIPLSPHNGILSCRIGCQSVSYNFNFHLEPTIIFRVFFITSVVQQPDLIARFIIRTSHTPFSAKDPKEADTSRNAMMLNHNCGIEATPPVGVVNARNDVVADFGLQDEYLDHDFWNNVDLGNLNFEDCLDVPYISDESKPTHKPESSNSGVSAPTHTAEASGQASKSTDAHQDIFSNLKDFDTPLSSKLALSPPHFQNGRTAKELDPSPPIKTSQLQSSATPSVVWQSLEAKVPQAPLPPQIAAPARRNGYPNLQDGRPWSQEHVSYQQPSTRPPHLYWDAPPGREMNAQYYEDNIPQMIAPSRGQELTPGDCDYQTPICIPETPSGLESSDGEETPIRRNPKVKLQNHLLPGDSSWQPNNKSLQLTKPNIGYVQNGAYKPLRRAPKAWGHFRYTKDGELEPSDLFTAKEINHYLFEHPLHQKAQSKRKSKLVLRIHRNPPDSAKRFPTVHGSHRCRFRDCPALNNTINQGQYAVIFDELTADNPGHDPFLNAGWVHLYCLERFCNFPKICRSLNVQVEKRNFKHESSKFNKGNNRMRLDKIRGVDTAVESFIETCRQGGLPNGYPRFDSRDREGQPYEGTLLHKMCLKKQKGQPSAVNRQEAARE